MLAPCDAIARKHPNTGFSLYVDVLTLDCVGCTLEIAEALHAAFGQMKASALRLDWKVPSVFACLTKQANCSVCGKSVQWG